jgi:hypothetical protein
MYTKKLTYQDFSGQERTETFRFNFTKAELIKMQFGQDKSLSDAMTEIIEANSISKIVGTFEDILLAAYGELSEDNRQFVKSPEIRERFKNSQAYSEIFMSFFTDGESSNAMAEFVNGVMPADLMAQAKDQGLIKSDGTVDTAAVLALKEQA